MDTFGSIIAHLFIVSVYQPMILSFALRRSHGYPIVTQRHSASKRVNSSLSICCIMRSVISSSHLGERGSSSSSLNIELSNLSTPIFARFPRERSVGFSTIPRRFPLLSFENIPKFSGFSTSLVSAPCQEIFLSASISDVS